MLNEQVTAPDLLLASAWAGSEISLRSAMIKHLFIVAKPSAFDHPCQRIAEGNTSQDYQQRVLEGSIGECSCVLAARRAVDRSARKFHGYPL